MSKSRKHGVFAVKGDVVVLPTKPCEDIRNSITVAAALENIFKQMKIAGNRERTIQSYEYIFNQFIEMNRLTYVEDISIRIYLSLLRNARSYPCNKINSLEVD